MSEADRDKWNLRYSQGGCAPAGAPNALLVEWLPKISPVSLPPRAVDVACGLGRHALYLARHDWQVDAVDISEVALGRLARTAAAEGLAITCIQRDLETDPAPAGDPFEADRYDLAVMMRYTNLPLIGLLAGALRPGGYLITEAYLKTADVDTGPRNPSYRVSPGAFREAATGLEIIDYREGTVTDRDGRPVALAQLIARRR